MKKEILGYWIDSISAKSCASEIMCHIESRISPKWLACLNPHSYIIALNDDRFRAALNLSSWLIPDGVGIILASKILNSGINSRLTGWDIFCELNLSMNKNGNISVFFLGSTEEVLLKITNRLKIDYPNIKVVGIFSPPYKNIHSDIDNHEMVSAINAAQPDVLWVGMTAPKQEKWLAENIFKLNVFFAAGIGAVFDFYAGEVRRSPLIFQKLGLEWLPRLLKQPLKLWRRMFISAPIFLFHIFKARYFLKK